MPKILISLALLGLIALNCTTQLEPRSRADILGIKIGVSKEEALKRLQEIGKLDIEERKQQQIWTLNSDPHYSHLIVAYDKEKEVVRFITAKAKVGGTRVGYKDVLDTDNSKLASSANNYKYTQEVKADGSSAGYIRVASGNDPNYLTYFSLKELNMPEEEEEGQNK